MITWPTRAFATTVAQAPRSASRSGAWDSSTGVGTHTITASAAAIAAESSVRCRRSPRRAVDSRTWSSGTRSTDSSRIAAMRERLISSPITVEPISSSPRAIGSPT